MLPRKGVPRVRANVAQCLPCPFVVYFVIDDRGVCVTSNLVCTCICIVLTDFFEGGTDGRICLYVHVSVAPPMFVGAWSIAVMLW